MISEILVLLMDGNPSGKSDDGSIDRESTTTSTNLFELTIQARHFAVTQPVSHPVTSTSLRVMVTQSCGRPGTGRACRDSCRCLTRLPVPRMGRQDCVTPSHTPQIGACAQRSASKTARSSSTVVHNVHIQHFPSHVPRPTLISPLVPPSIHYSACSFHYLTFLLPV